MNLALKGGVTIEKLTPQGCLIALIVAGVYEELGLNCVITSGDDGDHMKDSLHFEGKALDFRTNGLLPQHLRLIPGLVKTALGADFDVVLENKNGVTHLHVEYDPKKIALAPSA